MAKTIHILAALFCVVSAVCGCATRQEVSFDAQNPAIRVSHLGVLFGDTFVEPREVPELLSDYDIPKTRTIHIRLDSDVRDLSQARTLMGYLGRAGYMNPVLVTERHSESVNLGTPTKKDVKSVTTPRQTPRKIRYKRSDE